MPSGPQGQRRPAGVVGCAMGVPQIGTGEIEDIKANKSGRVYSGIAGVEACADASTSDERIHIAKKAAAARWQK